MSGKRKFRFIALLVDLERPTGEQVIDRHEFTAVSLTGAKRAASQWYNRRNPEDRWLFALNEWWPVGNVDENRWVCMLPSGLGLIISPLGSSEDERTVQRLNDLMTRLRQDPQAVRKEFSRDKLLAKLELYFGYLLDEAGGSITDQALQDADLVYDWPKVPAMLARVWHRKPGEVRKMLGRRRQLSCPSCRQTFWVTDERRKGGYAVDEYICVACQVELVDIPPESSS